MTYPTKTQMLSDVQHWQELHKVTKNLSQDLAALLQEKNSPEHNHVWMIFEAYTKALAATFGDKIQTPDGWAGECLLEQMVADGGTLNPVEYVDQVIAAREPKPYQYARGSEGNEVAI